MKIGVIGDPRGTMDWAEIKHNDYDTVIFMGNYFDPTDRIDLDEQLFNFDQILEFKKAFKHKVILLIGGEDFNYFPFGNLTHFKKGYHQKAEMITGNDYHLEMCYSHAPYIFTNAGVTKAWCKEHNIDTKSAQSVENDISNEWIMEPKSFQTVSTRGTVSPITVNLKDLIMDQIDKHIQVVGKTPVKEIGISDNLISVNCQGFALEILGHKLYNILDLNEK